MARLIMRRGPDVGRVYELKGNEITLGRGRKNKIIIRDYEVSREHCRFILVGDKYELHDLGSSNGTFVNGHPVDERGWILEGKSLIELGESITLDYVPDEKTNNVPAVKDSDPALNTQYYLVVRTSSQSIPAVYPLDTPTVTIGRGLDNDIVIQAPETSRHHMRMTLSPNGYIITDLGSLNGTSVNDNSVTGPTLLHMNDVISVGTDLTMSYTGKPENLRGTRIMEQLPSRKRAEETTRGRSVMTTQMLGGDQEKTNPPDAVGSGIEPGELEGHVMIAYAQDDWTKIVFKLFASLEDRGVPIWADQYLTYGSDNWRAAIEQALIECDLLVAVISPEALSKEHVRRSIRHFLNREKPVILFHYKDVERLPMSAQRLPAVWYNAALPDNAFRKLADEIRQRMIRDSEY